MKVTLEQVIKEFDSKIESTIKSFNLKDVEDIKQDIYSDLVRRRYLNKYKSNKSKLSTYLYTFLINHCKNANRNLFLKKRIGKLKSVGIKEPIISKQRYKNPITYEDILPSPIDFLKETEFNDFVDRLGKEAENKVYSIKISRNRKVSLKKVMDLLVSGYNIREIAKILKVSDLVLVKRFRRFASKPWVRQYFDINENTNERSQQPRGRKNLGVSSKF